VASLPSINYSSREIIGFILKFLVPIDKLVEQLIQNPGDETWHDSVVEILQNPGEWKRLYAGPRPAVQG